jgi:uncharacterized protein YyaL (SSP411 family)
MNRLSKERSPYLKHSAYQKIDWYPWCEEAFQRAEHEDKPVFLSSGAIWCHWCHVMAKECFADGDIAKLSGGGWPLSVFLTHDKKPFFGGTYFPPEDRHGSTGFKKVLTEISAFYTAKKEEISEYTERLIDFIKPKPLLQEDIKESSVEEAMTTVLSEYDPQNGGFGLSPKFPMPGVMEFMVNRYCIARTETVGNALRKTLKSMAKGGFHDQLQGGFHRYSTDEAWIIPHFEKMADDNSWLLRHYIDAYSVFGDEYFKKVAEGIINFLKNVISDPDGGFYASQDADVTPDDEGGYFTWRDEDFRDTLNEEEFKVISMHFFHKRGSMHHDKSKNVLFVAMEAEEIAREIGKDVVTVTDIINLGKAKLLKKRNRRDAPFIDRTLYTSLNGMLISSCLHAYKVLKDEVLKDFALRSLGRIMKSHYIKNDLFHTDGVKAVLDDYIFLVEALIAAYEVTGELSHLIQAEELMEKCLKGLWDTNEGGFFDSEDAVLGIRLKGIEDIPHPSANSVGIMLLMKLYYMTGKDKYNDYAETALKVFTKRARDMGIHSGYYFCALDAYYNMLKLTLETTHDSELAETALSFFSPYTTIVYAEDNGSVTPCVRGVCLEPVNSPDRLRDFLENRS